MVLSAVQVYHRPTRLEEVRNQGRKAKETHSTVENQFRAMPYAVIRRLTEPSSTAPQWLLISKGRGKILVALRWMWAVCCFEPTQFRWELCSVYSSYAAGRRCSRAGTHLREQVRNKAVRASGRALL